MAAIKLEGRRFMSAQPLGARLMWEAQRAWRTFGPSVALGLLLGLGAVCAWWQTRHAIDLQKQLQQQISDEKKRAQSKPTVIGPSASELDLARQLTRFYDYLPAHKQIPDQVKKMLTLAQQSNVTLAQAEYKVLPEQNAAFMRYHMILPVKAEARAIQHFMQSSLHEIPTLVLESVTFKRENGDAKQIEARIQFQLLVKKPGVRGGQS